MEAQQECHVGNLFERNHNFLHGMPTSVLGCWLGSLGASTCSNKCIAGVHGCTRCIAKRERRCRVYNSGSMNGRDNRMPSAESRDAMSIVAINDLKDQICKQGAAQFARDTVQRLLWSYATDVVKNVDLTEREDLRGRQNDWL